MALQRGSNNKFGLEFSRTARGGIKSHTSPAVLVPTKGHSSIFFKGSAIKTTPLGGGRSEVSLQGLVPVTRCSGTSIENPDFNPIWDWDVSYGNFVVAIWMESIYSPALRDLRPFLQPKIANEFGKPTRVYSLWFNKEHSFFPSLLGLESHWPHAAWQQPCSNQRKFSGRSTTR